MPSIALPVSLRGQLLSGVRSAVAAFSPIDLFATGSQGIWLDPSDLTTMFSDRAGTTPVTTPGTVVGKRLDKSGRGNHAVAPTDAARPIYGVEPKGGRRNLLLQTEAFGSSDWVKSGVTASAHNVADPDGGFTASTITATASPGYFYPNTGTINPNSGSTAPSLWIRRRTGSGDVRLRTTSTPGVDTPITVTSSWQRIFLVCVAVNGSNCWVLSLATSGDAIDVWHPQLELGSTATNYQKVTTAYDVTESGVATTHYVQYDGSDDSMSTSAIDFTATDKMSVFAGVRKLSDATTAVLVETSAAIDTNDGAFLFRAPAAAGANSYRFDSKGTIISAAGTGVFAAAPITSVLTGLGDISGDTSTLRLNGVVAGTGTGDQGTGNFGNYPLFIGRRNNATLPFNGRDYGIIVVGKAASAGEITDTETWLAARTSGVTL